MTTLITVFVFMLMVIGAMAIGVIMGRKPISGSCGGMSAIGMDGACDICGGDRKKCEEESQKAAEGSSSVDFYDATKR